MIVVFDRMLDNFFQELVPGVEERLAKLSTAYIILI
jgi:hypothetical protein